LGNYQKRNLNGVVVAIQNLKGFDVNKEHIKKGLSNVVKNTGLLGRWQVIGEQPLMICDTAHNKEGLQSVLEQLNEQQFDTLHIVLGFVSDKNIENLLSLFPVRATYYFVSPNIARGFSEVELQKMANTYGLIGEMYPSVKEGLVAAKKKAKPIDLIYVGGSTFVVAEVL